MQKLSAQSAGRHVGVGQIHPQYRIVFLYIGTEEQQRSIIQAEHETRQIARVAMVNPVGAAIGSDNITATIEHREGIAVLQRAQSPLLKGDVRFDVEWRL